MNSRMQKSKVIAEVMREVQSAMRKLSRTESIDQKYITQGVVFLGNLPGIFGDVLGFDICEAIEEEFGNDWNWEYQNFRSEFLARISQAVLEKFKTEYAFVELPFGYVSGEVIDNLGVWLKEKAERDERVPPEYTDDVSALRKWEKDSMERMLAIVVDPFYRYKMPLIEVKYETKNNKTHLLNLASVAKALGREPEIVCKFFELEVGTGRIGAYILKGHQDAIKLQLLLNKFISDMVLCDKCSNPETKIDISGSGRLYKICKACGERSRIVGQEKLCKQIIKLKESNTPKWTVCLE